MKQGCQMIGALEFVVRMCGKEILSLRGTSSGGPSRTKNHVPQNKKEPLGTHFSTRADRESLKLGLPILEKISLHEVVIAEEKENISDIPKDCVVFDPLDGTTNFFNGGDDFGVTVCVLRDGRPVCGATYFPVRDLLVSAVKGKGCYRGGFGRGTRIRKIPFHGFVDKMQIGADIGPWVHTAKTFNKVLKPLSRRFTVISNMSAIEGARTVLFGQTVAYYNLGSAKIWDAAAMSLAIEEAGGVAVSPDGSPLKWNTIDCNWIVAANKKSAKLILEHTCKWPRRRLS